MSEKILIVDDEPEIADLVSLYLQNENFTVYKFYSAIEALNCIGHEKLDMAILDVMMPEMNGFELCKKIREHYHYPIIMLTAKGEEIDKITGLTLGADDYIVKPFNLDEVAARVTVQLRNHVSPAQESQASQKLSFKNLVLNPETFELESGEQTLRLGKKEFQIFETLLAHPKKIFTKEELYEAVWEEVYLPGDNTLNAQLSNLRKKIAQLDPDEDYIETVWGLGVRLKGDK